MTVRSSRRRLRIRLRCVRSSNRRTFACVRRPAATAASSPSATASSPSATALASSGSTTAPSPTSAYALCPRQLRRAAPRSAVHACERSALCAAVLCATLWFRLCFARILCTQPATVRCTVHGVGVPLGTSRRAHCREIGAGGRAPPRALRGVACAGQWRSRRAREHLRRLRQRQRRRLDPHEHSGARALPSTLSSTCAPRLPSGGSTPHGPRSAARRGLRVPAVPFRRYRLGALVLAAQWGTAG
jgi:hypothetical protein